MNQLKKYFGLLFLVIAFGCSKSEDADVNNPDSEGPIEEIPTDPERVDYNLLSANNSGVTLGVCECAISETVVTQLDNGTPITFVELMTFDGHLNIYQSPTDGTLIAAANIGSNAF